MFSQERVLLLEKIKAANRKPSNRKPASFYIFFAFLSHVLASRFFVFFSFSVQREEISKLNLVTIAKTFSLSEELFLFKVRRPNGCYSCCLIMAHKQREDYLNLSPCIFTWYHTFSQLAFDGGKLRSVYAK